VPTKGLVGACHQGYNLRMSSSVRHPAVSGMFYPSDPVALRTQVERLLGTPPAPSDGADASVGLIAPHAGYMYSGAVAGSALRLAAEAGRPEVVVLLGASHSGLGAWAALPPHAAWETPLGVVSLEQEIVAALVDNGFEQDATPFVREHSMEVQLPLLQVLWDQAPPIVPICVRPALSTHLEKSAAVLADTIKDRNAWILASSDFTHYETDDVARDWDGQALERILAVDYDGFRSLVRTKNLSICGATAIELMLRVCKQSGLTSSQLVQYATSGDITGDRSAVVGYASVVFQRGEV